MGCIGTVPAGACPCIATFFCSLDTEEVPKPGPARWRPACAVRTTQEDCEEHWTTVSFANARTCFSMCRIGELFQHSQKWYKSCTTDNVGVKAADFHEILLTLVLLPSLHITQGSESKYGSAQCCYRCDKPGSVVSY
jgi:hypothetical protein